MTHSSMSLPRNLFRALAFFSLTAALAGCGESPSAPLQPTAPEEGLLGGTFSLVGELLPILNTVSEESIGPAGGTLEIAGGHTLHFPAGALQDSMTIRAVRDPLHIVVDLGPEGLVFPDSARPTLTFKYQGGGLLGLLNPADFVVLYLDQGVVLDVLPTVVDRQARTATAELEHFSTYAFATD